MVYLNLEHLIAVQKLSNYFADAVKIMFYVWNLMEVTACHISCCQLYFSILSLFRKRQTCPDNKYRQRRGSCYCRDESGCLFDICTQILEFFHQGNCFISTGDIIYVTGCTTGYVTEHLLGMHRILIPA